MPQAGLWPRLAQVSLGYVDTHIFPLLLRPHDFSADGFNDWAFMTTHSWDEDPSGEWVLEIENTSDANNYGRGVLPHPCLPPSLGCELCGHPASPPAPELRGW